MRTLLPNHRPALVLAPMQDVTDLPFMRVIARRGVPDWFVTEYFRVHPDSTLHPYLLRSILENHTGKAIFAQLIGSDVLSLVRSAKQLETLPVAGIDLNLGCPAPIVCRKQAGGGLLREPAQLPDLLSAMRDAVKGSFTVKTRIGYHSSKEFPKLLEIFAAAKLDGLTIHARTVVERYQTPVHSDCVRLAVATLDCPVIANGNVIDTETAQTYLQQTGAHGLMIGRGAIRNPWIFKQLTALDTGTADSAPTHRDLLAYIIELHDELAAESRHYRPDSHVQRMKKTLAYISHGLADGEFERQIRRVRTREDFFHICHLHLDHDSPLPPQPPLKSPIFCGFDALLPCSP